MKIGIDVGGTTITSVLINSKNKIIKKTEINTEKEKKKIVNNIFSSIDSLIKEIPKNQIKGIGLGFPGLVDRKGIVLKCPNLLQINNLNISKLIKQKYKLKAKIENDANCAALAESRRNKKRNLICLTLGTGLGSGLVIDSKLYYGKGSASELGHITIDKNGLKCSCGNQGCLEEYVSKRAILRHAKELGIKTNDVELISKLARKNKKYKKIFEEFGKNLGVGLANIVNIFDPELIVLTGGISSASNLFLKSAIKEMKSRAMIKPCPVTISTLKEYVGAFGAALLFE